MITCEVVSAAGHPLAGVAVSDGRTVVVTGDDGSADLDGSGARFIWVSRPTGYDTPRWWQRIGVDGVVDDRLPPSRATVTFVLEPVDQPLPVTFAQITDLHVSASPEPTHLPLGDSLYGLDDEGRLVSRPLTGVAELAAALAEVADTDGPHGAPRFVVATGDLTDHGTVAEFELLHEALATSSLPVHVLPGNHDHYGHLHEPRPDDTPLDSDGMGTGTVTRFEEHVGPRWWSLTHAGLRLVAIDWFSHRLGLDRDVQEDWLAADLATAPAGTAVLFLTHDQMPSAFFARVAERSPHVRIVGSLSGHWHTSRVVHVDGQLHANTGNTTFGSFDWAPAHARMVGWDGAQLSFRTVALDSVVVRADQAAEPDGRTPPSSPAGLRSATFAASTDRPVITAARWTARIPGAVHLARPVRVDTAEASLVVTAWSDDDAATGGLIAHDLASGAERWRVALPAPVRAGASWHPDAGVVVGVSVSGGVVAVDADAGRVRWRAQLGDPIVTWVHATPVDLGGAVAVGEPRCFAALELADGAVRWTADPPSHFENIANLVHGVLHDEILVVPFTMLANHTVGLDPRTGATRWQRDGQPIHSPISDVVPIPGGDVALARLGGRVERLEARTGTVRWATRVAAAFVPGRPVLVGDGLVVTTALGAVHRFDVADGASRWVSQLPGDAVLAMGPYRRHGLAVVGGPTLLDDDRLAQATGDGMVHLLDAGSGALERSIDIGRPMTVPALAVDGDLIIATADGVLARVRTG